MNVAVTVTGVFAAITQGLVPVHPPPVQPVKVEPLAGVAPRVTPVPGQGRTPARARSRAVLPVTHDGTRSATGPRTAKNTIRPTHSHRSAAGGTFNDRVRRATLLDDVIGPEEQR